ncbi:MAG: FAD-dependent oxidoreductase [Anaerolineae bacterium]|jgi:dimethylglycine dehydrogenase
MKTHARVVVVGGGVVGCSVLYHLTKKGWSDVVLCERAELASGTASQAIGHVILYTLSECVSRLNQHGVELYTRLEEETGLDPGFHICGNLRLATHPDRLDEFKRYLSVAEAAGVNAQLLTTEEVKSLWPLLQTEGLLAGIYNPDDGHIGGSDLAQALAAGARQAGAEVYCNTEVIGFSQQPSGEWLVQTKRGDIVCEHVVSCTGNYAWQTLKLVDLKAQSVPVKHEYLMTEPLPELIARRDAGLPELPVMRDPQESYYVRQEGMGLAFGCYEGRGEAAFIDGVPADYGPQGLPADLDKLMPFMEKAVERVPLLGTAGIMAVTHAPMPYTPDDMPTTGPAFGLRNFWLGEGNPFGITLAGGIGWQLAEWIVEGEPSIDMWPCDSRRYGEFATRRYSARKVEEAYEHTYRLPKPEEELPAARPLKTTPIHDLLTEHGAVFGAVYGWERPNWYAPEGVEPVDVPSFYRANYFEHVGDACRSAREGVGIADASHAARFAVTGPGAEAMLDRLLCTRLPEAGAVATGYALSSLGTVRSEFTVVREAGNRFLLTSAAGAERYDLDLLQKARPADGSVDIENLTGREGALAVFGPGAARLIGRVAEIPESDVADIDVAPATVGYAPARIVRSRVGGEDGWQIQLPMEFLRHAFMALMEADAEPVVRLVGARALNSLRLEAGAPAWGADLTRAFTAMESGLGPLIDFDKGDFRGREALLRQQEAGLERRLVRLEVSGNDTFDAMGQEPVRRAGGEVVGRTTSGGFGHTLGKSLAMAYVSCEVAEAGGDLEVKLMNEWFSARIFPDADGPGRRAGTA